jgi:NAD(P)H dehydrogenase (quinone)
MYAVTGATGQFGRLVIASLLERVSPGAIVALARDPSKAADLRALGVRVRGFDYDLPGQMPGALDGVTRLLLVSSDTPNTRIEQHRAVIGAAARNPVELIAYTSIIHADTNPISLAQSHRATEEMIAKSGLSHAILRNSWYIENYLIGAEAAIEHGVLLGSSGDGAISTATGAVGANRIYELAGDEAFTLADVAAALAEASGRAVTYRDLPESEYRDALVHAGLPARLAADLAEYSAKAAGGILADHMRTLSRLIGRPTATLRDTLLAAIGSRQ